MTLARIDPFDGLMTLRQAMDHLFEDAWVRPGLFLTPEPAFAPVDLAEDDQTITVKAALPGFTPEEIDITASGRMLTITAEQKKEEEHEEQRWHRREIRYGRVERTIALPAEVNAGQAEAKLEQGILTLRLPKMEAAQTKRIAVTALH